MAGLGRPEGAACQSRYSNASLLLHMFTGSVTQHDIYWQPLTAGLSADLTRQSRPRGVTNSLSQP